MNAESVIEHMKNGWELGSDTRSIAAGLKEQGESWHVFLQQGGIGSGGKHVNVPEGVMELLLRKKMVEEAPRRKYQDFWLERWSLRSSNRQGSNG